MTSQKMDHDWYEIPRSPRSDSINATKTISGADPEILADAQLVAECIAAGRPIPSEVVDRVDREAGAITERIRREYGEVEIGTPAIRELREDLPNPCHSRS